MHLEQDHGQGYAVAIVQHANDLTASHPAGQLEQRPCNKFEVVRRNDGDYISSLGTGFSTHFTPELLDRLQKKGIGQAFVTLHVGVGTFRPVETENITHHQMHGEWVEVSPETVEQIRQTKNRGGRVIAVGTTSVRSLEAAAQTGEIQPYYGKTSLFIYPGYQWRVVEGLITNFHLPKSSLLMLVSALIGRERLLKLYQDAIEHHYRFYSFGDAMIILPEAKIDLTRD